MSKFRRKAKKDTIGKSMTSSLPDIIFMLLFFFMTATTMKDDDLNLIVTKPQATEIEKLERKELVAVINVGKPTQRYQAVLGSEPRIQINDMFYELDDIASLMIQAREQLSEVNQAKMIVNINADQKTSMGIITDIKQELRKAAALKINYAANPR